MVSLRPAAQQGQIGKVVRSSSHCDYVVQLDTRHDVDQPPNTEDYGFGRFVRLEDSERHWAVGIIYDSQLFNSAFFNSGPRLTTTPDPVFTPDLIQDTLTLLSVVLVGSLRQAGRKAFGQHGIPSVVVPVNTSVYPMTQAEVHRFHHSSDDRPQFCYYSHLLRSGGSFAAALTQQVLTELIDSDLFAEADQRALQVLCKELSWKSTMGLMR